VRLLVGEDLVPESSIQDEESGSRLQRIRLHCIKVIIIIIIIIISGLFCAAALRRRVRTCTRRTPV